jgi:hypothetical protein
MREFMKYLCLMVGLAISSSGQTATWVLSEDFGATNPSGAWSYGYSANNNGVGPLKPFTLNTYFQPNTTWTNRNVPSINALLMGWSSYIEATTGLVYATGPVVGKFVGASGSSAIDATIYTNWNAAFATGYAVVQQRVGGVVMAPSASYQSVVQWKAPVAGTYFIKADFYNASVTDPTPGASSNVYVYVNGVKRFTALLNSPNAQQYWSTGRATGLALAAGSVVQFAVDSNSNGTGYDAIGLDATIMHMDSTKVRTDVTTSSVM